MADHLSSRHRNRHGQLLTVARRWKPEHLAAGYHLHEWGEHAHAAHELLGEHATPAGACSVTLAVDVPLGAGGPEFLLAWSDGTSVTVLDADAAREYLEGRAGPSARPSEPPAGEVSSGS